MWINLGILPRVLLLSKLHIGEANVLHGEPLRAKRELQWGEPPCERS
jgi:hypothetical protein